ncbi:MAG TPA: flagellar basal body-associated FliL family protein [Caldithrix abyssi]|uniref:Flagellar protein FliL n=1 Tax=Caldithrix abyssi TaxID=187145 RepID=A0A7V4UCY2_CALAY|nr:flagellar basal body-associated FliL family protein [Caldithrix abyssi]
MAETDSPESMAPEAAKGKSSNSKIILISTIVFIQVVAAITLIVFVILPKYQETSAEPDQTQEESVNEGSANEDEGPRELGQIYKISDLTVNPKGSMGRRFAVFEVALEVETVEDVDILKRYHPLIVDGYINFLRKKTVFELATDDSLSVIKNHLKEITNEVVGQDLVYNIYFTRFVLQ